MKHIIIALAFATLLAGCSGSSSPWDRPYSAQTAEQAPRPLAREEAAAQGEDPRLAYYRDMGRTMGGADNGMPPGGDSIESYPLPGEGGTAPYMDRSRDGVTMDGQSGMIAPTTPYSAPIASLPPVKVALLVPLSGPHAELGQAMLQASQLALFDMGYDTFELMPRDTGNTTDGARQAATSAINDGAQLILGPVFADAVRAVQPIAASRGVNVVAFSTDWTLAGGNTYVMGFLPFGQVQRITQYAGDNNLRRIAILAPRNDYGDAVITAFNAAAQRNAMPQASVTRFNLAQSDLSDVIRDFTRYEARQQSYGPRMDALREQIKSNPNDRALQEQMKALQAESASMLPYDAILLPAGGERARAIGDLLRYYDVDTQSVRLLGTGLWDDPTLTREPALRGAWFAAPEPGLRAAFERNYRDTYGGSAPPRLSTLAYDATALAVVLARNGFRTGGQPNFSHSAITNSNGFAGIDGIFRFRPDGLVERGQAVLEIGAQEFKVLDKAPNTFQQAAPRGATVGGL